MRNFFRDRLALGAAVCVLLLTLVLFYGQWRNVLGLSGAVAELQAAHATALALDRRATDLDARIAALGTLPRRTTAMALENQVRDMAYAAGDLERHMADRHRHKLARVQTLLTEIAAELHEEK